VKGWGIAFDGAIDAISEPLSELGK